MRFKYQLIKRPQPSISLNGRTEQPRPIVPVTLVGPYQSRLRTAQVDSGSDETFFHDSLAAVIGIDLTNAPVQSFKGQGGGQMTARFARVVLRMSDGVESREWPAWVGFVSTGLRRSVLGFGGFLQFFDATFRGADEAVELAVNRLYPGV